MLLLGLFLGGFLGNDGFSYLDGNNLLFALFGFLFFEFLIIVHNFSLKLIDFFLSCWNVAFLGVVNEG